MNTIIVYGYQHYCLAVVWITANGYTFICKVNILFLSKSGWEDTLSPEENVEIFQKSMMWNEIIRYN